MFAVAPDGTRKQLDFGPGTEIGLPPPSGAAKSNPGKAPSPSQGKNGNHLLDLPGGTQLPPTPDIASDDPNAIHSTAWALVQRAAVQCDVRATGTFFESLPPWQSTQWFVYPFMGGPSCGERLYMEQNLLCIADKLAEIGDAVGTVIWPATSRFATASCATDAGAFTYGSGSGPADSSCTDWGEWHIPPQAGKWSSLTRHRRRISSRKLRA